MDAKCLEVLQLCSSCGRSVFRGGALFHCPPHRHRQDFLVGGAKSHTMTLLEFFERGTFCGQRYCRWKDQKPPLPDLALKQDFAKGRGLKPKVKKRNCLNWKTCENLMYLKRMTDGGLGADLPAAGLWGQSLQPLGNFCYFLKKKLF